MLVLCMHECVSVGGEYNLSFTSFCRYTSPHCIGFAPTYMFSLESCLFISVLSYPRTPLHFPVLGVAAEHFTTHEATPVMYATGNDI